jgi:hypothetical protein
LQKLPEENRPSLPEIRRFYFLINNWVFITAGMTAKNFKGFSDEPLCSGV